jgi:hypothetical protein
MLIDLHPILIFLEVSKSSESPTTDHLGFRRIGLTLKPTAVDLRQHRDTVLRLFVLLGFTQPIQALF